METMSTNHAKFSIGYHIIWCTKYRHQILRDAIEIALKRILAETCSQYDWKLQSLEIMSDHVHIFLQADPTIAPAEIAKTLKSIPCADRFLNFSGLRVIQI